MVVIEEGRIAEHGTHSELLANDGLYTEMFRIFDETTLKPTSKTSMLFQQILLTCACKTLKF